MYSGYAMHIHIHFYITLTILQKQEKVNDSAPVKGLIGVIMKQIS
jgi:hypothetical protein